MVREAGKVKIWQMHDPDLYEALATTPNVPVTNLFLRLLMLGTAAVRSGFTRSVRLSDRNMQRDQLTAMMQTPLRLQAQRLHHRGCCTRSCATAPTSSTCTPRAPAAGTSTATAIIWFTPCAASGSRRGGRSWRTPFCLGDG